MFALGGITWVEVDVTGGSIGAGVAGAKDGASGAAGAGPCANAELIERRATAQRVGWIFTIGMGLEV